MLKEPKDFQYLTLPNSEWWEKINEELEIDVIKGKSVDKIIDAIRLLHVAYIEAWHIALAKESGVSTRVEQKFDKVIRQAGRMQVGKPMGD